MKLRVYHDGVEGIPKNVIGCNMFPTMGTTKEKTFEAKWKKEMIG
jgi:hypothetical protein